MPVRARGSAPKDQLAEFRSDGVTSASGLRVAFFTDSFSRAFGLPETRLINQITEATPLREERPYTAVVGLREVHYSRPALVSTYTAGTGPIRGVTVVPPLYGGGLFMVSAATCYNAATGANLGAIGGTDLVRFAQSRLQLVAVASGTPYLFNGTTFAAFTSTILPPVSDVAYLAGRFVYTCTDSDQFYYSEPNDATNVKGLNFATAESYPDPIVGVGVLNEGLVFFGKTSVEFWQVSSDPAAPFVPVTGQGFQRGCAARGSIAFVDNSLCWVADNRVVYKAGASVPVRISSESIEDKLRQCVNMNGITSFSATFEGHELYVLNIPGIGSYAYDASRIGARRTDRGEWAEWHSWNRANFRGQVAAVLNDVTYVGDDTAGTLWAMTVGAYTDGSDPLVRVASAFIKVEEGNPRCNNIVLHCVPGVGNPSDPGSNPLVEMRYSDDQGRTFSNWRAASLGALGKYKTRVFWQRLGSMRAPGRLVEIRCSEAVNVVFSHLELNADGPAI